MSNKKIIYGIAMTVVVAVVWSYVNAIYGDGKEDMHKVVIADSGDAEMVALGETVYVARCAECHGGNLEGQPGWRKKNPDGTIPAPPHDETGHTWHHPDAMNFQYTKFGGEDSPQARFKTSMPAFAKVLSDHEILSALSYIKSKWPEDIQAKHQRMSENMMGNNLAN